MTTSSVQWSFPHYQTRVEDKSAYTPLYREELPLHRPIWFMRAQKGPVNVPVFCGSIDYAYDVFGYGTFDKTTKFYSRESVFASTMFTRQGGFFVRLADASASVASLVIECHMKEHDIPVWERDIYGNFVLDVDGNPVPSLFNSGANAGTQRTLKGWDLSYRARVMDVLETITGIQPKTVVDALGGGTETVIYPIVAVQADSPGSFAESTGFKMYFDPTQIENAMVASIGAATYMFQPVEKTYGQDTVTAIRTAYGDSYTYMSLKDSAIDSRLSRDVSLKAIIESSYFNSSSGTSILPYRLHVYSEYVETIGTLIADKEVAKDDSVVNGHTLNIFGATNIEGKPLNYATVSADLNDPDSISLNKNFIIYLRGGSDGDITDDAIEELTRQYLMDDVNLDIDDPAKVPITHLYDTGVSLPTKEAMINFLSRRDDVKIILSTQDANRDRMNTKDEDISVDACGF